MDAAELNVLQQRQGEATTQARTTESSVLFLQIFAAADYFSMNETLMANVPPVLVDIILDSYLIGIFPRSLVPTAGYILAVAIFSWFVAGFIYRLLSSVAQSKTSNGSRKVK